MGGMPYGLDGPTRQMTLGHEPASKIGAAGAIVICPKVDDRVLITRGAPAGFTECGGAYRGAAEDLLVENANAGRRVAAFRATLPFELAKQSPHLAEHAGRSAELISHLFPITEVHDAFKLALSPGAAEKVVVSLSD
jgi:hypothetical protein